ncbi:MAG: homoserine dehydrogenase [Oscillospiraceae bacterium]|nr:homoserine dehydrogenase [Oscillospiraceae bacterium]
MIKYAILGYGTVGRGVAEVMAEGREKMAALAGQELELGYILVRRAFPGDPYEDRMVQDFSIIENDPEVAVVAEVMGGTGAAYEYSRRALLAGKSVVTSNKELVAARGLELEALAREHRVSYLFEGSVGGGIPILRPLYQCLAANRIDQVFGILNGTTNYILTAMDAQGQSFEEALKDAQTLGYAEADPTADVEGHDAGRKITILADLAFGKNLDPKAVPTQGITGVTAADLELAHALGYTIKLLGRAIRTEDGCRVFVAPHLVPMEHMLAGVSGVMNACVVRGSAVGEVVMYGPGAGKRPTASAVCADILDATVHLDGGRTMYLGQPGGQVEPEAALSSPWFIRTGAAPDLVLAQFPQAAPIYGASRECGLITAPMTRDELEASLGAVEARAVYRVLE